MSVSKESSLFWEGGGIQGGGKNTSGVFLGGKVPGVSSLMGESSQVLCLYVCRLLIYAEHLNYGSRNGIFILAEKNKGAGR